MFFAFPKSLISTKEIPTGVNISSVDMSKGSVSFSPSICKNNMIWGGLDLNQMGVYQCTPVHFELNQAHLTFKSVHDDHLKGKWLHKLKKKLYRLLKIDSEITVL